MMNLTFKNSLGSGQMGIDWGSLAVNVGNVFNPNTAPITSTGISTSSSSGTWTPAPPPPLKNTSTVQTIANQINNRLNLDQIFALGSQAIAAWGKNPTQQIGGLTVQTISPATGYNPQAAQPQVQQLPPGYSYNAAGQIVMPNGQIYTPGQTIGNGAASAIDGIFSFVQNNLLLVAGGGIALWLLFKEPPRKR